MTFIFLLGHLRCLANRAGSTCLSLEEVIVDASHEVIMEVGYISLIVGDPKGILDQQIRTHPIILLNTA
jgi:hypothetical protein